MTTEAEKPRNIITNKIKTPDGTVLISRHVHDHVSYTDKITGGTYFVDGGHDYSRRGFSGRYEELTVYDTDHFELIRHTMEWGTRGIKSDQPLQYLTLCCMGDVHIQAILATQPISPVFRKQFLRELAYRKKKGITVQGPKI